jgi:hypothetical protein
MAPLGTITLVLAFLSSLILLRLLLPNVLAVLGLAPLRHGYTGGPEDASCYWPARLDDDLYQEMCALGFEPLGTYWERLPFTRRFEEFVFSRLGENCFGLLYPNDQIMPRRGSFITVFETGGVVFTKNYCGGVEVEEGDFLATGARTDPASRPAPPSDAAASPWNPVLFCLAAGLLTVTLVSAVERWQSSDPKVMISALSCLAVIMAILRSPSRGAASRRRAHKPEDLDLRMPLWQVLARHRLNVNQLLAQGQRLPAYFDGEEFLASLKRYYRHPTLRRRRQSSMVTLLAVKLIVIAPVPAVCFSIMGVGDPLPWGVLLAEGLVGLYLRYGCSSAMVVDMLRGFRKKQSAS